MKEPDKPEVAIIKKVCDQLMEHFDTVQIFVSRTEDQGEHTRTIAWGAGNWYARYGQTIAWLDEQNARLNADDDEDDDD